MSSSLGLMMGMCSNYPCLRLTTTTSITSFTHCIQWSPVHWLHTFASAILRVHLSTYSWYLHGSSIFFWVLLWALYIQVSVYISPPPPPPSHRSRTASVVSGHRSTGCTGPFTSAVLWIHLSAYSFPGFMSFLFCFGSYVGSTLFNVAYVSSPRRSRIALVIVCVLPYPPRLRLYTYSYWSCIDHTRAHHVFIELCMLLASY